VSDIEPDVLVQVSTVIDVPRITDAERGCLIANLDAGRADIAAGNYDVLTPGMSEREFDAILAGATDAEIDAQLSLTPSLPR
jgi:hypothetical protein